MEHIIKNAVNIENTISHLKNEINILKESYNKIRIEKLTTENRELVSQVEEAKKKLIELERSHGVPQIAVPSDKFVAPTEEQQPAPVMQQVDKPKDAKVKKEKKKPEKKTEENEPPVDVGRLDMRVGQIMQVEKHPDADSLYVSKIQCGEPALRTVVSGLVKFVPIDELKERKVIVLCNLKPVKMRGVLSEAMVMCASTPDIVEVLSPPTTAQPGDLIECDGYQRQPDAQLNPKKKIFESVAPDLKTNDSLEACYKGSVLTVTGKGPVVTKSLKNVNIK